MYVLYMYMYVGSGITGFEYKSKLFAVYACEGGSISMFNQRKILNSKRLNVCSTLLCVHFVLMILVCDVFHSSQFRPTRIYFAGEGTRFALKGQNQGSPLLFFYDVDIANY